MELIRAFIAIEVSKLFKDATHEVAYELARILPSNTKRFANSNATHITLNFIGQMDINAGHAVHKAMIRSASAAYPFELSIGQLGGFPSNEMPRIVWLALGGGLDALGTLQRALSDELESVGMQRQTRKFRAHVTLGRVKKTLSASGRRLVGEAISSVPVDSRESLSVSEISLFRSKLSYKRAYYSKLLSVELGTGACLQYDVSERLCGV